MPRRGKGLTPPRPTKYTTVTQTVRWNAQMTCANPSCPKKGQKPPRHQLYPYCQQCARAYRKYGDPNGSFIGRYRFKHLEPRVERLIELNKHKDGWAMVERFIEAFGAGRSLSGSHEFYHVPIHCSAHENFKPDLIVTRLGALVTMDELPGEKAGFLANRHRDNLLGWHLLKMCKVMPPNSTTMGAKARMYITIGKAIWEGIGLYLLNIARTLKRQEDEKRRNNLTLFESLDTE